MAELCGWVVENTLVSVIIACIVGSIVYGIIKLIYSENKKAGRTRKNSSLGKRFEYKLIISGSEGIKEIIMSAGCEEFLKCSPETKEIIDDITSHFNQATINPYLLPDIKTLSCRRYIKLALDGYRSIISEQAIIFWNYEERKINRYYNPTKNEELYDYEVGCRIVQITDKKQFRRAIHKDYYDEEDNREFDWMVGKYTVDGNISYISDEIKAKCDPRNFKSVLKAAFM